MHRAFPALTYRVQVARNMYLGLERARADSPDVQDDWLAVDGIFVSFESWRAGRVRLVEGRDEGFVELEGSPDMVLEIISRSSVKKDTIDLSAAYWEAEIIEYWLVDARRVPLRFDIYRHTPRGYIATRKQGGWLKSAVFGKSFRLSASTDQLGRPAYTLEMR